jgi:hypothetical protein
MRTFLLFLAASAAFARSPQPRVTNARFATQPFSGNLAAQIQSDAPSWFGYAITATVGEHQNCCWNGASACGCNLENGPSVRVQGSASASPVQLEDSSAVAVLFRSSNKQIDKLQVYSLSCPLDAGGLPFVWIANVPATASLAYLPTLVRTVAPDHVMDGAILALAQHDNPQADVVLEQLTQPSEAERIREKAIFWLGAARGARAVVILKNILAQDSAERIRDKAVFALSINKQPEALPSLIHTAKSDPSPHVRSQALFWLSQKAGKESASTIVDAIQNDPDTGVKKRAVFALSQLPKDEAVPKLIGIAQNQRNPEVRKQAFFWLGQSNDPRALAFVEQVLSK